MLSKSLVSKFKFAAPKLVPKSFAASRFTSASFHEQRFNISAIRSFSTSSDDKKETASTDSEKPSTKEGETESVKQKYDSALTKTDYDDYEDDYDEPAPDDKAGWFKYYMRVAFTLSLFGLGGFCIVELAKVLWPGRMGATGLFGEVFEKLRNHDDIIKIVGENPKGFGKDYGRKEGRRHMVDNYTYTGEDGSSRNRVKFNIKGDKGQVLVFAEVSDQLPGDYVYIIVQNVRTGAVKTIVDNRNRLDEEYHELLQGGGGGAVLDVTKWFKKQINNA